MESMWKIDQKLVETLVMMVVGVETFEKVEMSEVERTVKQVLV